MNTAGVHISIARGLACNSLLTFICDSEAGNVSWRGEYGECIVQCVQLCSNKDIFQTITNYETYFTRVFCLI